MRIGEARIVIGVRDRRWFLATSAKGVVGGVAAGLLGLNPFSSRALASEDGFCGCTGASGCDLCGCDPDTSDQCVHKRDFALANKMCNAQGCFTEHGVNVYVQGTPKSNAYCCCCACEDTIGPFVTGYCNCGFAYSCYQ